MTDVALIIKVDSRDVGKATIALEELAKKGVQTEVATKSLTSATGSLMAAVKNAAAAFGLYKLGGLIKESALLNARFETMGIVMKGVGKNAGYSQNEMTSFEMALRKTGISMIEARENVTKMAQAQLDLSKTSELARVAQDAAVIGNLNSSDAFARVVHGIQAGQTETLRTIGINVDFQQSYEKLAKELGTTEKNLTETQKAQARMNAVIEYGTRIAGTYESAMGTAGKQLQSMKRYVEDLKVKLGETFNDALTIAVFGFSDALKDANKEADNLSKDGSLKAWGEDTVKILAYVADGAVAVAGFIKMVGLSASVLVAQAKTLVKPGGIKEFKQLEAMYQAEEDKYMAGLGSLSRAADKFYAEKAKKQQTDLNRESNYLKELAVTRKAYASQPLKTQQKAVQMLYDRYYPETVKTPTRSTATGVDTSTGSKSDPQGAFIAKLRDEAATLGMGSEALERYEATKLKLTGTNAKLADGYITQIAAFKTAAGDAEFFRMVEEDGIKTTQEWRQNLIDLANVDMSRLGEMINNSDFSKLAKDQEDMILLAKAFNEGITDADGNLRKLSESEYLDIVKNRLGLVGDKLSEADDTAKQLGMTFTSAFEDAIIGGKKFSDVLKGLAQDVLRIMARKAITEPLANAAGNWAASLFNAQGNVFPGETGLSSYRNTVVDRPTTFAFAQGVMGEEIGSPGEAIMPLQRMSGGDLGVKVAGGGGGGGVTVNNTYHIDARGAEAGVEQRIRRAIDESEDRAVQRSVTQVQSMNQRGQLRLA
jgi:acylphosphatase